MNIFLCVRVCMRMNMCLYINLVLWSKTSVALSGYNIHYDVANISKNKDVLSTTKYIFG